MRYFVVTAMAAALLLSGCAEVSQGVQDAQQAVEAGKQAIEVGKDAVELGKEVVQQGKQLAESEVAQQLKTYLQQKYDSSAELREAMFSGDGKLVAAELKKTELTNFTFFESELMDVKFTGKLTADGTFQVLRHSLSKPDQAPEVVKEYNVILDPNGQIQVQ